MSTKIKSKENESNKLEKIVFLTGKKTILRPLEESDVNRCTKWINDPEVAQFIATHRPTSIGMEKEWIDGSAKKEKGFSLAIETLDGVHIGNMGIHDLNWTDRVATTGALIGDKRYWGKGYGTDAKMQLLNYLFNTLGMWKICSSVIEFNERSLAYSKHCGYVEEGRRRKHVFRHGKYWDLIELGLFKDEWTPYWEKYQNQTKSPRRSKKSK